MGSATVLGLPDGLLVPPQSKSKVNHGTALLQAARAGGGPMELIPLGFMPMNSLCLSFLLSFSEGPVGHIL